MFRHVAATLKVHIVVIYFKINKRPLTVDSSARETMKDAAKCDKHCELQNSVNQQNSERIMRIVIYYFAGLYQRRFKPPKLVYLKSCMYGLAASNRSVIVCNKQHIH